MYAYYLIAMLTKQDDLVGSLIHDVAHLLRLEIDRRAAPYNLTRTKWLAISQLHEQPGITQSELAGRLELGAAATGKLVDRLVDRGFVERRADAADRRIKPLHLTDKATHLLRQLEIESGTLRRDLLGDLSPEEREKLRSGLLKLKTRLQAQSTPDAR